MIFNPCSMVIQYDLPYTNQHVDGIEECNGSMPNADVTVMNLCVTPDEGKPKGGDEYSAPNNIEHGRGDVAVAVFSVVVVVVAAVVVVVVYMQMIAKRFCYNRFGFGVSSTLIDVLVGLLALVSLPFDCAV